MLVVSREDGFLPLLWLRWLLSWRGWPRTDLPPPGFSGQGFGLYPGKGAQRIKPLSIRLRRKVGTSNARLWRLTCVWETYLPQSLKKKGGNFRTPDLNHFDVDYTRGHGILTGPGWPLEELLLPASQRKTLVAKVVQWVLRFSGVIT